jgi:hypothetical protein
MLHASKIAFVFFLVINGLDATTVKPVQIKQESSTYVYGEQIVALPLSVIAAIAKPELVKSVWGH